MTDIRSRLADAIAEALESNPSVDLAVPFARGRVGLRAADWLLSLPGIAIVELPQADDIGRYVDVLDRLKDRLTADDWQVFYDLIGSASAGRSLVKKYRAEISDLKGALLAAVAQAQEEQPT